MMDSPGTVLIRSVRRQVLSAGSGLAVLIATPVIAATASANSSITKACPTSDTNSGSCEAEILNGASPTPTGLTPAKIKAVYGWPTKSSAGAGETIAIVDAHDNPTVEQDLGVFDSQFNLPSCTSAKGCFTKVDQNGGTDYPSSTSGWDIEINLDVQWAHAIAPGAKILLIEAHTSNGNDLFAAEDYAKAHAQYVSNSWGTGESASELRYDSHFIQQGVSFFVSTGDNGLPPFYPATSPDVIAVGGTQPYLDASGNLLSETGWSGGGGGCSRIETATPAQAVFPEYNQVGCAGMRATPDLAADASSGSPVSVYDSNHDYGTSGWFRIFGTSVAAPLTAARAADSGLVFSSSTVYSSLLTFRDITVGNNGAPCLVGYDLCSGRGSWIGNQP